MKATRSRSYEALWGYFFIAPQVLGLIIFTLLPVLGGLAISFTEWEIGRSPVWVGLDNFRRLVNDEIFWQVLRNTVYYTIGAITLLVTLSLAVAFGLNSGVRFVGAYRAIYFLPAVTSTVAISLVWAWMFNPDFGLINLALSWVGITGPGWTTSLTWAMPSVIIVGVWAGVGYNAVIFLAGLQGIPRELYEAATVDGAGTWARYKDITIPLLSPTIFFVLVISTIGALQVFNIVYLLTNGGPANATNVLVLRMFDVGFRFGKLGEASAIAVVLFLMIAAITAFQFRFSKWVHYD